MHTAENLSLSEFTVYLTAVGPEVHAAPEDLVKRRLHEHPAVTAVSNPEWLDEALGFRATVRARSPQDAVGTVKAVLAHMESRVYRSFAVTDHPLHHTPQFNGT